MAEELSRGAKLAIAIPIAVVCAAPLAALLAAPLLIVSACSNDGSATAAAVSGSASAAAPLASGSAAATAGAKPSATASSTAAAEADLAPVDLAKVPPTGFYDAKVTVVSDTCKDAQPWSTEGKRLGATGGPRKNRGYWLNVPMPGRKPVEVARVEKYGPYFGTARTDLRMQAGEVGVLPPMHPIRGCNAFSVEHSVKVVELGPTSFKLSFDMGYGDAAACAEEAPAGLPKGVGHVWPSGCKSTVEVTYTLAEKGCESRCVGQLRSTAEPGKTYKIDEMPPWKFECACE